MAVTVEQAREILGSEYDELTDDQIRRIIEDLYYLANQLCDDL